MNVVELQGLLDGVLRLLPSGLTIAAVVAGLWLVNRFQERGPAALSGHRFRMQMTMVGLTVLGVLIIVLVVPIGDARRGQLLSLIGILLSASIALSSTTFLGNAMAGIMLRAVGSFRSGDFITCGEHFGRVSERGLFHTEIQTEERSLTTLPNLYLVTNATTTVRTSGTIVFATASLGYDVPRADIEAALLAAATDSGLSEPFVHVTELGDFSVTYRVAGLLTDVKSLLSARSKLRCSMLDALHVAGIEIVSPTFMNTRVLDSDARIIPEHRRRKSRRSEEKSASPEAIVFDKADQAESIEKLRVELEAVDARLAELAADASEADHDAERAELSARGEALKSEIAERESVQDDESPAGESDEPSSS